MPYLTARFCEIFRPLYLSFVATLINSAACIESLGEIPVLRSSPALPSVDCARVKTAWRFVSSSTLCDISSYLSSSSAIFVSDAPSFARSISYSLTLFESSASLSLMVAASSESAFSSSGVGVVAAVAIIASAVKTRVRFLHCIPLSRAYIDILVEL